MKKNFLIHPLFIAIFPLLSYYNHNKHELTLNAIFLPLVAIIFFSTVFYFVTRLFIKNKFKAGIVSSLSFFMFFSYGHIMRLLEKLNFVTTKTVVSPYLIIIWFVILLLFIYLIAKSKKKFVILSNALDFISLSLIVILILEIGSFEWTRKPWETFIENRKEISRPFATLCNSETCPDIYYLIIERYANNNILSEYFHHDNSGFTTYLENLGFVVPKDTRSNYLNTSPSLASSLNMEYLYELAKLMGKDTKDRGAMYKIIEDNKVLSYLKSKGYKFINVGAYWPFTVYNKFADINYSYEAFGLPEFSRLFLEPTVVYPFFSKINTT